MSRYKVFLLQMLLIMPAALLAEVRSLEQARDIAYDFLESGVMTRSSFMDLQMVYNGEDVLTKTVSEPAYYVFNNEAGPGFVIVSAEDSSLPVLGYSRTTNFNPAGMPSNLRWWLATMRSQINDLRAAGAPAHVSAPNVGTDVIRYQTAVWNQADPYNLACPLYYGEYSMTGCGPTAISIAMRAREWPDAGVGTIPSYTTETEQIRVSARKLGTVYDWAGMPLTDGEVSEWTQEQKNQVSRLIADVGAATVADYSPESTGIYDDNVPPALTEYFKYDRSMITAWRDTYSAAEWYPLVRNEMNNGPVVYSGADDMGGHMFVLDGYTTEDYYHVNWGWGGLANGYYLLTALNPAAQGIGSNELGTYNQYQSIILNFKKDEGGKPEEIIRYYVEDEYKGLVNESVEFEAGRPYTIYSGYYCNFGTETYKGAIRLVVMGTDQTVRQVVYEEDTEIESFYMCYFPGISITIDSIEPGDCLIAQYYDNLNHEWKMVRGNTDNGVIESIELDKNTIERTTSLEYCHSTRSFTVRTKDGVSVECSSSDGESVAVMKNSDGTHTISMEGCKVGGYYIDLSDGRESKRIGIKL